ncbi:MAG: ketoacyl-ACP synthase III [Opitutales bacterium]|nr:ketoacyl-ACP synthase III [Opitutales bacterium]
MAKLSFDKIGIRALSACVPATSVDNATALRTLLSPEEIEKTVSAIGIRTRHVCGNGLDADSLCLAAAKEIFTKTDIAPDSIDVLLHMSQSKRRSIPATATELHAKLGLTTGCAALDLSLGCSGYIFALASAYAYVAAGAKRVLLTCGDALSKIVDPADRVNAPLYGDAGTATIVEAGDFGNAEFVLHTDGGSEAVKTREDGKIFMDGMEVFNFAIRRVPAAVKSLCPEPQTLDWLVFHQANKMMTDFLAARLRVPAEKLAYSLQRYGNVSAPSIPLTIAECLADAPCRDKVLACGFGAGFSWGAVRCSLAGTTILKPIQI